MGNYKPDRKTFEYELKEHGILVFTNVGTSMMPLIRQNCDLVEIIPKGSDGCKKYDVVLYKRDGKYILHRIIKVRKDDYVIVGDHQYRREYGVKDEQIIGVLQAVVRGKRRIAVTDITYRLYAHIWCDFYHIRAMILYIKRFLKRKANC